MKISVALLTMQEYNVLIRIIMLNYKEVEYMDSILYPSDLIQGKWLGTVYETKAPWVKSYADINIENLIHIKDELVNHTLVAYCRDVIIDEPASTYQMVLSDPSGELVPKPIKLGATHPVISVVELHNLKAHILIVNVFRKDGELRIDTVKKTIYQYQF